jgi:SRSO17 transposase
MARSIINELLGVYDRYVIVSDASDASQTRTCGVARVNIGLIGYVRKTEL